MEQLYDFGQTPIELPRRKSLNDGLPLVSIITPYYNSGKYIHETAVSVLNQTFPYFEWIIVNDGSNDEESINILNEIKELDNRIKVYYQENSGPSRARNVGAYHAATDIIVPLDSDDLIIPTYLECAYIALKQNPEASWAYTDSVAFNGATYLWVKKFDSTEMKKNNILTCTAAIRKSDFLKVGGYDEALTDKHHEDWAFWLTMLRQGLKPVHLNILGFWYRRTDTGRNATVNSNNNLNHKGQPFASLKQYNKKVEAIEFPRNKEVNFDFPAVWDWDRKPILDSKKKKLLFIFPHMEMGGADLFNIDLLSRISLSEFEISIITTSNAENTWQQRFEKYTVDIFNLSSFLDVKDYASFMHYLIKSRGIDLIMVSNSYYSYYILPWLKMHFPHIPMIDYVHMEEWYWRNGGYARLSCKFSDIVDKTYVCNEHLRQLMINHYSRNGEDVETMYIGVDETEYSPDIDYEDIYEKYEIDKKKKIILFPCRIHPQKRPFLMLEIVKKLSVQHSDIVILVVGDGPSLDALKQKTEELELNDYIIYCGRQKNLRPYYKAAYITLLCSIQEGLALTAYESLSMGTPMISSDVGGHKELIDKEVGAIIPMYQDQSRDLNANEFPEEEIDEYVREINHLFESENEYNNMCINARKRIIDKFSKKILIKQFESEVNAFLDGKGAKKREDLANALKLMPNYITENVTLINEYIVKDSIVDEIWAARCYYEKLHRQRKHVRTPDSKKRNIKEILTYFAYNNSVGRLALKCRNRLFRGKWGL